MGVEAVWYLVPLSLRRSGDEAIGTRGRVVARILEGDWRTHSFWTKTAALC